MIIQTGGSKFLGHGCSCGDGEEGMEKTDGEEGMERRGWIVRDTIGR